MDSLPVKQATIMETLILILHKAGFRTLNENLHGTAPGLRLLYIKNPDGSVRWAWPAQVKQPLFLRFYNADTRRARFFQTLIRLVFTCRLARFVFPSVTLNVREGEEPLFDLSGQWAVFTGTTGPNRKAVFFAGDHFIKVALGREAPALLQNEKYTLNKLAFAADELPTLDVPVRVNTRSQALTLSDVSARGIRCPRFTSTHLKALTEIRNVSGAIRPLRHIRAWMDTKADLEALVAIGDPRLPKGMLRKLTALMNGMDEEELIATAMSHGDFTLWNMYKEGDTLHVYDWELSRPMMPVGYDAFHFIIQQGILVDHLTWKSIDKKLHAAFGEDSFSALCPVAGANRTTYLRLYLLMNTVYYLKTYNSQGKWHTQVWWLLQTWNEALSSVMEHPFAPRQLVLMDLFDLLCGKNYAALKFTGLFPEHLPPHADLDLCVTRQVRQDVVTSLKRHPLVKRTLHQRQSFMDTLQVFFADGSMLSIDLIRNIKRKELVMMDAAGLLKRAYLNEQGIRMAHLLDSTRYTGLFYALNHARVPEKYKPYGEVLRNSDKEIDGLLHAYFADGTGGPALRRLVKKQECNRGISGWINRLNYLKDIASGLLNRPGMVITFSGVDGAGKSTVIENIRWNLDKQLRKKVVVIRHRPSLIPILSAWTKGKAQAEKDAAQSLPRQGNNYSLASSALRFAYYYADYFLGQFYIYFRYVMRGYVVLYDRYYFDFINDSRRSNIKLPAGVTRFAYRLLLKPDLNFFLYADAQLILQRKQELDAGTITRLTEQYLSLFSQLDQKSRTKRYIPVENTNLSQTLQFVMNRIHQPNIPA